MPDPEKNEKTTPAQEEMVPLPERATFPPTGKKRQETETPKPHQHREKVVQGEVKTRKKGFGRRVAEVMIEDDSRSVGSYIFSDVIIPAAKYMILDIVGWGGFAEMMLLGGRRSQRTGRPMGPRGGGGVNYNASYRPVTYGTPGQSQPTRDYPRDMPRTTRVRHNFDEIVIPNRGDAEQVLDLMLDLVSDYGQATVADFLDFVGITTEFTDNKYGWVDLRNAQVVPVRSGYILSLPRVQPLD